MAGRKVQPKKLTRLNRIIMRAQVWAIKHPVTMIVLLVCAIYSVPAAMLVGQSATNREQNEFQVSVDIRNCRRTDIHAAFVRGRTQQQYEGAVRYRERLNIDQKDIDEARRLRDIAKRLFPILDCKATAIHDQRTGVALPEKDQERYVKIVMDQRWPIVWDGKVIGSQPFPEGGPTGEAHPVPTRP